MKKSILTLAFSLLAFSAFALSNLNISGQFRATGTGASVSGKLISVYIVCYSSNSQTSSFAYDSLNAQTDGTGSYSINRTLPSNTFKAHVYLYTADCDNQNISTMDTVSNQDSSITWSPLICAIPYTILSGVLKNSDNSPAANQLVTIRIDSLAEPTAVIYDTTYTNASGEFSDSMVLKRGWRNGTVTMYYGCSGQQYDDELQYFPIWKADKLSAQVNFGQKIHCRLPTGILMGSIKNSSNAGIPFFTFTVRIDSINANGDSLVRTITTKSNGTFLDSFFMGFGLTHMRYTYRIDNCSGMIIQSGSEPFVLGRAVSNHTFNTCGPSSYLLPVFALIYQKGNSGPAVPLPVLISLYDSANNLIDTFHRLKPASTMYMYYNLPVPYYYNYVFARLQFEGCLETHTYNSISYKSAPFADFGGHYYYCGSSLPSYNFKAYAFYQGVKEARNGTAYLIRYDTVMNGSLIDTVLSVADSITVNADSFVFSNVQLGRYKLKFAASASDPDYSNLLNCYYDSAIFWRYAENILIDTVESVNMSILEGSNTGGPGFIAGSLSSGANKTGNPISNITVLILDAGMKPIRSTLTDASGLYSFSNLPLGKIYVLVDVPGRSASPHELTLTATEPGMKGVNFLVHKKYIEAVFAIGIEEKAQIRSLKIYPNPAKSDLNIQFNQSAVYDIRIYDLQGREVWSGTVNGMNATLNIQNLPKDSYLLRSYNHLSNEVTLNKFILD